MKAERGVNELPYQRDRPEVPVRTPLSYWDLRGFDDLLDARSPAEYAEDHLPDAVNVPVLDDAQRELVGTIYKQRGAFEAKRVGAPIVARNIAAAIERLFADKPRNWKPLVYCWRGGGRSNSLAHVLRQVGWDARRIDGGYKAFRKQVVQDLATLPERFDFRVVCGATGSGKSRLLEALAKMGAQVLDLEVLAAHRGSVLGDLPGAPQPSQKAFETAIWSGLSQADPARPVYVESESKKVGNLRVPERLIERMRESRCIRLEADVDTRVALLLEDYAHFVGDPHALQSKLDLLRDLHGVERIAQWKEHLDNGRWQPLVRDLLESHYDPAYKRSLFRNYRDAQSAAAVAVDEITAEGFARLARQVARDSGG
jgi:tRNA 2-selenouridine synthase